MKKAVLVSIFTFSTICYQSGLAAERDQAAVDLATIHMDSAIKKASVYLSINRELCLAQRWNTGEGGIVKHIIKAGQVLTSSDVPAPFSHMNKITENAIVNSALGENFTYRIVTSKKWYDLNVSRNRRRITADQYLHAVTELERQLIKGTRFYGYRDPLQSSGQIIELAFLDETRVEYRTNKGEKKVGQYKFTREQTEDGESLQKVLVTLQDESHKSYYLVHEYDRRSFRTEFTLAPSLEDDSFNNGNLGSSPKQLCGLPAPNSDYPFYQ